MRHIVWLFVGVILSAAGPVSAQPVQRPVIQEGRFQPPGLMPPVEGGVPRHEPREGEEFLEDLRGWLDGTLKPRGKAPPLDPKMLGDLLSKMKERGDNPNVDPREFQDLLKDKPQFRNPEFLKMLEKMMGERDFPGNLKPPIRENGQDPGIVDRIPKIEDKLGNFVEQAKKAGPDPRFPDGKLPDVGPNGEIPKLPDINSQQTGPKLDPVAQEWVKWMEKNFGDSPGGQQAIKEMVDAMGKGDFKGVFDDLPDFKTGEWKEINDWGKGNFGESWKFRPPDWNLSGGGNNGPLFGGGGGGGGGSGISIGGGPSIGGGGGAEVAGGGLSVVAIVIGVIGAAFLAYILYRKWQREQEARQAMIAASRRELDLTRIRTREELVEAFDTLTLEKLGDESRNWNHRVVTETFADTKPEVAEPVQELGELYQKARYAPPQDVLTKGELSTAERDLRAVAGVNP